jgi:hypothetical protein
MWLFTKHGFFSVVCGRADAGHGAQLDSDTLMIRSRRRAELAALIAACPELAGREIAEDAGTDYRYRLVVPRHVWQTVAAQLAAEIDYGNFKSAAGRIAGTDYVHALHEVWDIMHRHQRREPARTDRES